MIISKTPILLVHLLGLCLAVGPVLVLDARLSRLLLGRPVERMDIELTAFLKPWIRVGLGLLWASGASFLVYYAIYTPEALTNPKLHAKLVVVVILTLNGILVERYAFGQMAAREGRMLLDPSDRRQRRRLLAVGALSATSWYIPLLLGTLRELNFACATWVLLAVYALSVVGAFCCLALIACFARSKDAAIEASGLTALVPGHLLVRIPSLDLEAAA